MPLIPEFSQEFQERFAAWLRIEPRCRQDDFGPGVQARTADALWFLTRQWQMGELQGEDAGSPIKVELEYSTQSVDRIRMGDGDSKALPAGVPLERLVEQERAQINYRERVRIGQEFERRLRAKLASTGDEATVSPIVQALRAQASVGFPREPRAPMRTLDRATQRFVRFMAGRVVDGETILKSGIPFGAGGGLDSFDAVLAEVRQDVVEWYAKVCARPDSQQPPAWQPEALDYRFETNSYPPQGSNDAVPKSQEKTELVAPDYRNGNVDWYTFAAGSTAGRNWDEAATRYSPDSATPTRIEIAGTSARWWAFEDSHTDFGSMNVAKPDLAKLMLMEMALIYGDDWFSVPARVPLGNLARIDGLRVWNVFGEDIDVMPGRMTAGLQTERFDMFTLSPASDRLAPGIGVAASIGEGERPLLFVPPVSGYRMESSAIDEIVFLRDEGANMVWGIEKWVPNGLGRPVDGFDAQRERLERANEIERAGLETLLAGAEEQLRDETLSEEEAKAFAMLGRVVTARLAELEPYARPTPSQDAPLRYRLSMTVPENWIPFVPEQRHAIYWGLVAPRHVGVQLRRAKMLRNTDHSRLDIIADHVDSALLQAALSTAAQHTGIPEDAFRWLLDTSPDHTPSMSRLLALDAEAQPLLWLDEEAVPRAGLRVQLTKQRTRWVEGSTHVWIGRKVLTGRGEGASGLRFDVVKDLEP